MLDPQDEAYDRRLAHHLVSLYYQSEEQVEEEFLDMAVLKDYIAYAHSTIMPRLSEEASQALIEVTRPKKQFVTLDELPISLLCLFLKSRVYGNLDSHILTRWAGMCYGLFGLYCEMACALMGLYPS